MTMLLTGGAGFIGSCLLWRLNAEGITDILVADHLGTSDKWKNLVGKQFEDYMEKDGLLAALRHGALAKKIDVVIHLGACTSTTETDAAYLMENNYRYSRILAEWALAHRKRFLYASSAATYGDGSQGHSDRDDALPTYRPLNMYGYSKHLFDLWVLRRQLQRQIVGLKFFNVYGPNESHKGDMRSMVHKGYQQVKANGRLRLFKSHRPEYRDGEQRRDFIYVKDVVDVVWHFLEHPQLAGIYNVGTGQAQPWNALASALFTALGLKPAIDYVDMPETLRGRYQYFTQADTAKLREAGYASPWTDLQPAVKEYVGILETAGYL